MQHVCAWQPCAEDERFQVCGDADCGMWRWDPAYSDREAIQAHRKVEVDPSATGGITGAQIGGNT
jgi:hypothetical protein